MNKVATRSLIYAALIFVAGLATGVLTAPLIGRSFIRPPSPEETSRRMIAMLHSRLGLTAEQTEQIKPLLEQTGNDVQEIWVDTTNRVTTRLEQTDQAIAAVLTPEQKPKLEALIVERRGRMQRRIPFGPPPGR